MYHRTKGLKLFNFKSPYVSASWILAVAGFFVARALLEPSQRYSLEHLGVLAIAGQPLPWKSWIILAGIGGILAGWLVHLHDRRRAAS